MLSVTLRQLEYASAIARHGGLTAAALALHVSQPALSVALAAVETHLGQPLFLRRPGGPMVPTQFGRGWLTAAEAQLHGIARLMTEPTRQEPLRLAVFDDLAPLILAPLLGHSTHAVLPDVMGFAALTDALVTGRADLAVTWDLGLPPSLRRHVVTTLPPQAVLAPDHPLAAQMGVTLADIARYPLVLTNQDRSIDHLRLLFSRAGLVATIAHRCASLELMRSFVANGLGVGLSYTQPAPRQSSDGKPLVVIPVTDAGREPVVLALQATAPDSPALPFLRDFLTNLLPKVR